MEASCASNNPNSALDLLPVAVPSVEDLPQAIPGEPSEPTGSTEIQNGEIIEHRFIMPSSAPSQSSKISFSLSVFIDQLKRIVVEWLGPFLYLQEYREERISLPIILQLLSPAVNLQKLPEGGLDSFLPVSVDLLK